MTFYKLWAGKVMDSSEHEAKYIEHDLNYFKKFVKDQGFEELDWKSISEEITNSVRSGKSPSSKEAKKLLTCMMIGDSDINEPMASWFIFPGNYIMDFIEFDWFHNFREMSRKYGNNKLVSPPEYSTPDNVKNRDEEYDLPFKPLRYSDSTDCISLGAGMITLEWAEYILNEMNLEYEKEKIEKAREEFLRYYSEREEMSPKSKEVLASLKECDNIWIRSLKEEFDINSMSLSWVIKANEKFLYEINWRNN